MSFTYLRELPSPGKIKTEYPLSKEMTALKRTATHKSAISLQGRMTAF